MKGGRWMVRVRGKRTIKQSPKGTAEPTLLFSGSRQAVGVRFGLIVYAGVGEGVEDIGEHVSEGDYHDDEESEGEGHGVVEGEEAAVPGAEDLSGGSGGEAAAKSAEVYLAHAGIAEDGLDHDRAGNEHGDGESYSGDEG